MIGLFHTSETVVAPDGRVWTVRRSLLPRPAPTFRRSKPAERDASQERSKSSWVDGLDGLNVLDAADGGPSAILVGIGIVVAWILLWVVVVPLLVFALNIFLFVAVAAGAIAFQILFRRPCKVEAHAVESPAESHAWAVVGLRASGRAVHEIAQAIERGSRVSEIVPTVDPR